VTREDQLTLLFVAAALTYVSAHVAWALMKPWVAVAIHGLPK
jgi:hypothetical protein